MTHGTAVAEIRHHHRSALRHEQLPSRPLHPAALATTPSNTRLPHRAPCPKPCCALRLHPCCVAMLPPPYLYSRAPRCTPPHAPQNPPLTSVQAPPAPKPSTTAPSAYRVTWHPPAPQSRPTAPLRGSPCEPRTHTRLNNPRRPPLHTAQPGDATLRPLPWPPNPHLVHRVNRQLAGPEPSPTGPSAPPLPLPLRVSPRDQARCHVEARRLVVGQLEPAHSRAGRGE